MFDWIRKLRTPRAERKLMAWHTLGRPIWSPRDTGAFAREGYARNAVAYRCVRMIAEAAASAPLRVGPVDHPLARVLARPNPEQTGVELLEAFYGHLQVSGNAYLEAASIDENAPSELYVLRPDRVSVMPGADGWPVGWEHRVGGNVRRFERDPVSGEAPIFHLKLFNPVDARPHPAFPARSDVWADGASWRLGHWLNGRAGLSGLGEVVLDICARADFGDVDVTSLRGAVSGYVVDAPSSAREALEPLMAAYDFSAAEREGRIVFFHRDAREIVEIALDEMSEASAAEPFAQRSDHLDTPIEARVRFLDAARDYLIAGVSARRMDNAEGGVASLDAPLVLEPEAAEALAQRVLADRRARTETLQLDLGPQHQALEPGDRLRLADSVDIFEVTRIEEAETSRLDLRRVRADVGAQLGLADPNAPAPQFAPTPAVALLDLPPLPGAESDERPLAAMFASPWLGAHDLYAGAGATHRGGVTQAAIMGELLWALWPGPVDRWDEGNFTRIKLYGGALSSATKTQVLDGANVFAIESGGEYEIIQARQCVLVAPGEYEISGLLRGRLGSARAMAAPHPVGARIVLLDRKLARITVGAHEWGEALEIVAPPAGGASTHNRAARFSVTLPHAAIRPWAPAHLRASRDGAGDVVISWVRCARVGGDSWGAGEPPLGEPTEGYRLDVLDGGGAVLRSAETLSSQFIYTAAQQSADFGAPPASLRLRVAQLAASGAPGLNMELTIPL